MVADSTYIVSIYLLDELVGWALGDDIAEDEDGGLHVADGEERTGYYAPGLWSDVIWTPDPMRRVVPDA